MAQVLERFVEYEGGFTHSPQMRAVGEIIAQIADTNAPVLIRGESGVGKDHVARIIHSASRRHEGPFIKLNCATIPPESVESELFGHERGASPGASRRKPGMLEFASEGTLFLDEIAELPRIPPLRDRKEEISFLTSSFLARFNRQHQRHVKLSPRQILEEIQARLPLSSVG